MPLFTTTNGMQIPVLRGHPGGIGQLTPRHVFLNHGFIDNELHYLAKLFYTFLL